MTWITEKIKLKLPKYTDVRVPDLLASLVSWQSFSGMRHSQEDMQSDNLVMCLSM